MKRQEVLNDHEISVLLARAATLAHAAISRATCTTQN
jgi:hypothetical protein